MLINDRNVYKAVVTSIEHYTKAASNMDDPDYRLVLDSGSSIDLPADARRMCKSEFEGKVDAYKDVLRMLEWERDWEAKQIKEEMENENN